MSKNFIQQFLEFTTEYESPGSFFKWSAYSIVAAVLRNNVYLTEGYRIICPNIYVLLLATSAMHRKSVPVGLAGDLVGEIRNTKIIRGRTSIQAVLDDLAGIETDRRTGQPIRGGSCILCAEELASFIVQSPETVPILTDIYDYRKEWDSRLRGGKFKIQDMCVSLIAASNEIHFKEVYNQLAIYGGLLGRTFLVKPNEFRKGNSLIKQEKEKYDIKPLIDKLREISKLKGEMIFSEDATIEFDCWYNSWRETCKTSSDKSGIVGRIHTGVKKIAMINAAQRNELVINKDDILGAIDECLELLPNYDAFIMSSGKSSNAETASILINELWETAHKQLSRKEILYRHFMNFDAKILDEVIVTLEQAGMIQQVINNGGAEYRLTSRALEYFHKKKETKDE